MYNNSLRLAASAPYPWVKWPQPLHVAVFLVLAVVWMWTGLYAQQRYNSAAVVQKSLELQSALTVLTIALQPGFEDFESLAYFRTGRGARLVTLYVTNGESGSSDDGLQIPGEIAFSRRAEAFEAMNRVGGFELFLNMPDFGSASDTSQVRAWWDPDTLQKRLTEMIQNIRPDMIVLAADLESRGGPNPRWSVLKDDLVASVRNAARQRTGVGALPAWEVTSVVADNGDGRGLVFPVQPSRAGQGAFSPELADSIAGAYGSLRLQLPMWWKERRATYDVLWAPRGSRLKSPDDGVPGAAPSRLRWIEQEIRKLNLSLLKKTDHGASTSRSLRYEQNWVVAVMDSVDIIISQRMSLSNRERKILLHWKEGLEELRNTLFGVKLAYHFRDSVLLAKQVTTVSIDSGEGIPRGGTTEIFFPEVGRQWMAGSETEQRQELEYRKPYRLISPSRVEFDLPATYGGQQRVSYGTPFSFFVFHTGDSRSENFFKKIIHRYLFAPKLTVEPVTPIVRIVPGEYVVVRMTNHSHDGLRDEFGVQDTLATSPMHTIRVSGKEVVLVDTLALTWNPAIDNGDYRVPLTIGGFEVAYFAARKFDAAIDDQSRVAIVPSFKDSPMMQTLRRLGVQARILSGTWSEASQEGIDVLVLDERMLTFRPDVKERWASIERFAEAGGRVIVCAQDPVVWNDRPLVPGIRLAETSLLDVSSPVEFDSTDRVAREPNLITEEDWQGWLFARSRAMMQVGERSARVIAREAVGGSPLVAVLSRGAGEIIVVNLSLGSQLMNIHPGASRLVANLLSPR